MQWISYWRIPGEESARHDRKKEMTICKPRNVTDVVHDNWWVQSLGESLMMYSTMQAWGVTAWILCSVTFWSTVEEPEVICLLLECPRKHTVLPRSTFLPKSWTCFWPPTGVSYSGRKYSSLLKWLCPSVKAQGLFCEKSSRHQQKGVYFVLHTVCSRKAPFSCLPQWCHNKTTALPIPSQWCWSFPLSLNLHLLPIR